MISRRPFKAALLAALCASAVPVLAAEVVQPPPPGYRPAPDSVEGGLWYAVEQIEMEVQTSPLLVRDEELNNYVKGVICKVAGPHCADIRLYIRDVPYFNAAAYPNGMIEVWTGALVRIENEAQLAFVLSHEMTHYFNRHTLRQFEAARDTTGALAVLSIATAGVGVGMIGALATLGAVGAFMSYSRAQETEADAGGFDLAVALGYEPRQAAAIWTNINEEEKANPNRRAPSFFEASHPAPPERLAALTARAAEIETQTQARDVGAGRYRDVMRPYRAKWLEAEIGRGEFEESVAVVNRLLAAEPDSGELLYFLAEAYRRRNAEGDLATAAAHYQAAIAKGGAPAAVYRGLGLTALKTGDNATAYSAFESYLAVAPGADDRAMIQLYMTNSGGQQ